MFRYDGLGNIRQRSVGARTVGLSYNAANQLSAHTDTALAVPAPVTMTALYDGASRRVKQVTGGVTRYSVYDASGALTQIDEVGGAKTDYIRAAGMTLARVDQAGVTWLHHDHLGSAVAGTNSAGAVIWRESEQPFGEDWTSAAANDNFPGYTGHVEDAATGLTYMQARYYDPVIGRFLSIDPVGFSPGRPDMFNRYAYAANDPVNLIDPDGQKVTGGENCESQPDTEVLVCDKVTVTPDDWDFNSRSGPGRPVVSSTLRPSRIEPPTPNTFHWNDPCSGLFAFAKTAIGKGGDMTKLQTFGLGAFFGGGVGISHTNFYDPKTGIYGYSDAFSWGPGLGGGAGVTLGTTNARAYEMGGNSVSINMGVSDASVGGSLSKAEDGRPLVSGSAGFESGVPGPFDNIRAGFSGTSDHATRTLCGAYK